MKSISLISVNMYENFIETQPSKEFSNQKDIKMNTVKVNEKITTVQNRLFEKAHSKSLELKPLAIELSNRGLTNEKLCMNPYLIPLPMEQCSYLSSLNPRQVALLSATVYANIYKEILFAESQTLVSNMAVAEKAFGKYSQEYMILYQETGEEYDHIWAFRTIYCTVCRELDLSPSLKPFKPGGFFGGDFGRARTGIEDLWHKTLQYFMGDGMRLMPPGMVQKSGIGALWLLYRYISNVHLKQTEAYLFDSPELFDYNPIFREITEAHLTDEARHYTTSLELGLELYKAASPIAQNRIRKIIKKLMESYISSNYMSYYERIELHLQGVTINHLQTGLESLSMTLNHPDFSNAQVNINKLVKTWKENKIWEKNQDTKGMKLKIKRLRYTSQQLERLREALNLNFNNKVLGQAYDRYQESLNLAI